MVLWIQCIYLSPFLCFLFFSPSKKTRREKTKRILSSSNIISSGSKVGTFWASILVVQDECPIFSPIQYSKKEIRLLVCLKRMIKKREHGHSSWTTNFDAYMCRPLDCSCSSVVHLNKYYYYITLKKMISILQLFLINYFN